MAGTKAAVAISPAFSLRGFRTFAGLLGNVRVIAVASLVLIAGSFASAALIQMRLDREHALAEAAQFELQRATTLSAALSASLDRYAAIGEAFAADSLDAESTAALAQAGGAPMRNVAVIDREGHLVSELKSAPKGLLPLTPAMMAQAGTGRAIGLSADEKSLLMLLPATGGRVVVVQLLPQLLLPAAQDALIAFPSGELLSLGRSWNDIPDVAALRLDGRSDTRILEFPRRARLVSLARLPSWSLVAGSSVDVGRALDAWYGALPLYFFFIFGPGLAGAGLAVVFVREFDRRVRTAEAVRSLRSKQPDEARLLVRLADAERRAVDAERAKAQFMAHMSHELRTPLNAIIGFSEVIEEGALGPANAAKYAEYARDIRLAGRQLHARIGDILDFADLDARRRALAADAVDVSALARSGLHAVHPLARGKGIKLLASLPHGAIARADSAAVERIFSGVLANAVEFTPNGGEVRLAVRNNKDTIVAILSDTGIGFSPEEKAKAGEAFVRFQRPGHATGLGLGLTIATTLARRMGGSLRIDSRQGEGTTIELRLPVHTDAGAEQRPATV